MPIDLHMEAVPQDMTSPENLKAPNPPRLHGNFAALERLLSHNPRANLIWAHAGQDNTGYRTPELMRALLSRHPNLFMEIKYDPTALGRNPPIGADGKLKAEWLKLYQDFPDRFIIGSDQHYDPPSSAPLARAQANAKAAGSASAGSPPQNCPGKSAANLRHAALSVHRFTVP